MAFAIVFNDARVINGKISDTLFEVADRVAANVHQSLNQSIRFGERHLGIIYKLALNSLPSSNKVHVCIRREWNYLEMVDTARKFLKLRLCLSNAARLLNNTAVFGAESRLQFLAPLRFDNESNSDNHRNSDNNQDG